MSVRACISSRGSSSATSMVCVFLCPLPVPALLPAPRSPALVPSSSSFRSHLTALILGISVPGPLAAADMLTQLQDLVTEVNRNYENQMSDNDQVEKIMRILNYHHQFLYHLDHKSIEMNQEIAQLEQLYGRP